MTNKRVLVCAAHPDDEVLGCGGVMAMHADRGDIVNVVFVADGVTSRGSEDRNLAAEGTARRTAAEEAAEVLGARTPISMDFPDQRLDSVSLLVVTQAIEKLMQELRPEIVYTHHAGDLNRDHRIVTQAVLTATRPYTGQTVLSIYGYEVLSSTEWTFGAQADAFRPVRFVSITRSLQRKMKALGAYNYEMRDFPHSRSYECVRALAQFRGGTVGEEAAEAFTVFREIVR